jgi:5-methylcytosine-specific restriction endonuclease McrA
MARHFRPDTRSTAGYRKRTARGTGTREGNLPRKDLEHLIAGLERLGLHSLPEYWETAHWRHFKEAFRRQQEIHRCCTICRDAYYSLHHRSYKRLGKEWLTDVVPLCNECHRATHDLLLERRPGVTLWNAHRHIQAPTRAT